MTTAKDEGGAATRSNVKGVSANTLGDWLDTTLEASRFKDYCPNGLQAEGTRPIRRLICGVTASLALLKAARAARADAVLVHHGWFWRGEDPRLIGTQRARVRELIDSGLHLFAYHLPLDAHPELGNNAQLARALGWQTDGRCGDYDLVSWHVLARPARPSAIAARLKRRLGRAPLAVGALDQPIRRIAWCTGAAQDMIVEASRAGADAFVSGEVSERTTHLARELGMTYFAAGHHATERFGVQALAQAAAKALGFEQRFIDDPNPV
jgi:dinuclear metal center YbgI/SA1388 family protein